MSWAHAHDNTHKSAQLNEVSHKQIKQIHTFDQLVKALECADQDTLILFDVDYTIWVPENNVCWYKTKDWQRNKHRYPEWLDPFLDEIFNAMKKPELHYKTIWHLKENPLLIDPNIVSVIQLLQQNRIPVFALTLIPTGSYGIIEHVPEWRFKKLKELDIDFRNLDFEDIVFHELAQKNGSYPLFYKGILCTAESKAKLLGAFLDRLKWKPKHIIFFDDTRSHVQDVTQEIEKRAILCTGYEYLAAYAMPITLDKALIALQFQHLVEHEEWLSDQKSCMRLDKRS